MANLDFFAVREDTIQILDFLFTLPGLRVFESYSDFDRELREFHSTLEITQNFDLGMDPYGNGSALLFQLWHTPSMPEATFKRIHLIPEAVSGHTFRYCIEGWGLMQLYFGGIYRNMVIKSHFGHNSEKRANNWDYLNSGLGGPVDWECLKQVSNKIQYHIKKRLAVAKISGRPILPGAYAKYKEGYQLKEFSNGPPYVINE